MHNSKINIQKSIGFCMLIFELCIFTEFMSFNNLCFYINNNLSENKLKKTISFILYGKEHNIRNKLNQGGERIVH